MVFWYKALIILIWLAVPVTAGILMRDNYNKYLAECQTQRADIARREAHLRNYTAIIGDHAGRISQVDNQQDQRVWERDFREMQRQRKKEALTLRLEEPEHYPDTDGLLLELENKLLVQEDLVASAMGYRQDYLDANNLILTLSQQIAQVEMEANFYKRTGAVGIYLLKQEVLAVLEDELRTRQRMRIRSNRSVNDSLAEADRIRRDILRDLQHLEDQLDSDEQTTYREELYARLAEFNLAQEIGKAFSNLGY